MPLNQIPREFVSIRELELHLNYLERALLTATQLMKDRMDGFPEQFIKKGESGDLQILKEAISVINAKIEILNESRIKSEGMASIRSLETVRWVAITSFTIGILGLILRFLHV